ncbi:MAG: hypothetical protein LW694_08130 [Chitinophagaceae bacterium]|nr:hypothetical protein [Chitinophagaceae bacterium]
MAHDNIRYYHPDTCLLGQLEDPVTGGAVYQGFSLHVTDEPGIAADIHPGYLASCVSVIV